LFVQRGTPDIVQASDIYILEHLLWSFHSTDVWNMWDSLSTTPIVHTLLIWYLIQNSPTVKSVQPTKRPKQIRLNCHYSIISISLPSQLFLGHHLGFDIFPHCLLHDLAPNSPELILNCYLSSSLHRQQTE